MNKGSSGDLDISNMMTSSNGSIFRVTGPLCGEFTGPDEFPAQRPVTRSFDVFFDPRLNKRLSKQPWGWWLETPPWSLWRQCNESWTFSMRSTQHLLKFMFTRRGTCWTNCRLIILFCGGFHILNRISQTLFLCIHLKIGHHCFTWCLHATSCV